MLFSGLKKTAVGATAALAAAGALALSATAVSATPIQSKGPNGQRVHLCLPDGLRGGSADIIDTNHPNAHIVGIELHQYCTAVAPNADLRWAGTVTINWRVWDGPNKTNQCKVPVNQPNDDDFFCNYDERKNN
ncbi:MAG: hypothetical protein DLM55_11050 [Acidimicrobiales bacterium]|nr:MAG: hypothetical protein DLM55_11050 [Acidimicrobiales bacterium]